MQAMVLERPASRSSSWSGPIRSRRRARSGFGSPPAAFAEPTCTWSTANCPIPSFRSCPAMKSSAASTSSAQALTARAPGMRVGIPWLGRTCGHCRYCREGRENLCDQPLFTGYTRDGGYATHVVADARYVFPLPEGGDDVAAAPLAVRGLDRLALAAACRRRQENRALWLRRRRAYHHASGALAGPRCLCFHQGR